MVIKKISTNLLSLSFNSVLRFHIGLYDNDEQRPKDVIYTYNDEYVSINVNSFMTLEIKDKSSDEWDPSKNVMITQFSIFELIKAVKSLTESFYKKDTFEIVGGVTKISKEAIDENTFTAVIGKSVVSMHPSVIYDSQEDVYYEGAVIYLNKKTNYIELHYSRVEALLHKLKQVDFTIYTLQLLTYYNSNANNPLLEVMSTKPKAKPRVFDMIVEEKKAETTGSLPPKKESMDDFFN